MKKKDLISKWLNFNLSDTEKETFENLDVSASYHRIDRAAKYFKAPEFNTESSYQDLKNKLGNRKKSIRPLYGYISGIAATLVVAFGLFALLNSPQSTEYVAENSARTEFVLPDTSEVILNAGSSISFKEENWDDSREVNLEGEAYFKVAKGKKFSVHSSQGVVTVLGTQFKVKDRSTYFEVSCYEGLVRVEFEGKTYELAAGDAVKAYGDMVVSEKTALGKPSWLENKSVFKSVPIREVIQELERQFDVQVSGEAITSNTLFSGSFSNQNLDTALQAITIPLNLSYSINGKSVVLKK
ncbi:FecR domain-containing protein [Aureitalea sp. L0-47]|uniref:FecR family protein n=1 Tax=Aureitalea sp. L0-47 TaxID=2816962 RepID=UPI002238CD60|nr:FecR domain-containing protein [Aureitalea sp. L0-47]MCW5520953.1 FecR domain-containing protein [Aureitalea sp. L0-47]